jgi:hypothetical protein
MSPRDMLVARNLPAAWWYFGCLKKSIDVTNPSHIGPIVVFDEKLHK